jgi:uncharacterized membrane protein
LQLIVTSVIRLCLAEIKLLIAMIRPCPKRRITAGLLLIFVSPSQIHRFLVIVTQREIIEDPNNKVSNYLLHSTAHISSGSREFAIIYLWIHAGIKLVAVYGLLKTKLWAYPFSLITLGILMLYQVYSIIFVKVSVGMIILTVFDIFILWLIWREYGKVRSRLAHTHSKAE